MPEVNPFERFDSRLGRPCAPGERKITFGGSEVIEHEVNFMRRYVPRRSKKPHGIRPSSQVAEAYAIAAGRYYQNQPDKEVGDIIMFNDEGKPYKVQVPKEDYLDADATSKYLVSPCSTLLWIQMISVTTLPKKATSSVLEVTLPCLNGCE